MNNILTITSTMDCLQHIIGMMKSHDISYCNQFFGHSKLLIEMIKFYNFYIYWYMFRVHNNCIHCGELAKHSHSFFPVCPLSGTFPFCQRFASCLLLLNFNLALVNIFNKIK